MSINKPVSLNLNVRGLGQSATLAINARVRGLREQGCTVYNFGLGQSPFPVPTDVVSALKEHAREKDYLPVHGLRELREAVASFHQKRDGVNVRPENVLIGPGSKELMFLLQLCYYGEIVLPTPCWVSYGPQAQIVGRSVRFIHTSFEDRWQLYADGLERFLRAEQDTYRPRLLVLNYPSNPHGGTYTRDELKAIANVAREYDILVLSDEIYGQTHFRGEHASLGKYYPEGTIISSGISKWCGAGGWRLGTFAFPPRLDWLMDAMAACASETYTSVCSPIQHAAITAFKGGTSIERYLLHVRRVLSALGNECTDRLLNAGVRLHRPMGAFYLFLDLTPFADALRRRGIGDGATMCARLLDDTGVAMLPGAAFERPAEELTARLSYIDFDGARALAASETVPLDQPLPESFLESRCEHVLAGVERLVGWLNGKG
jgi:aspartate aminotransferase